jgi:hypothetical protein
MRNPLRLTIVAISLAALMSAGGCLLAAGAAAGAGAGYVAGKEASDGD